ncbi:MAG: SDR family oxidoreductase [Polyangiaceae bacterium]|nr:SDR family oxidoreductase [Polyangiaceae bacterium]
MSARVAVVTGASRGIGRAIAIALARRDLKIALLGRPSQNLEATCNEVRSLGVAARTFACDVADEAQVRQAADELVSTLGVPEVVVNNAGIVRRGMLVEETSTDAWDDVIAINLRGPFLVSRALLPAMKRRGSGRLIHIGSISSTIGCARNASYAASKWGLVGFAKSLAEELRGTGLISVAVLPGSVDTDMLRGSGFDPVMAPSDVAKTVEYLALDAPAAVNGSAIELFG